MPSLRQSTLIASAHCIAGQLGPPRLMLEKVAKPSAATGEFNGLRRVHTQLRLSKRRQVQWSNKQQSNHFFSIQQAQLRVLQWPTFLSVGVSQGKHPPHQKRTNAHHWRSRAMRLKRTSFEPDAEPGNPLASRFLLLGMG